MNSRALFRKKETVQRIVGDVCIAQRNVLCAYTRTLFFPNMATLLPAFFLHSLPRPKRMFTKVTLYLSSPSPLSSDERTHNQSLQIKAPLTLSCMHFTTQGLPWPRNQTRFHRLMDCTTVGMTLVPWRATLGSVCLKV